MGFFGGSLKKMLPKVAQAAGNAAGKAKVVKGSRGPIGAIMTKTAVAVPSAKGMGKPKGMIGKVMDEALKKKTLGLKNGGMAEDKAGRALGRKTADSMGRAMKKGGMAKKKKC